MTSISKHNNYIKDIIHLEDCIISISTIQLLSLSSPSPSSSSNNSNNNNNNKTTTTITLLLTDVKSLISSSKRPLKVQFGRKRNRKRKNDFTLTLAATTNLVGTKVLKSTSTLAYTTNTNSNTPITTVMATTLATTGAVMITALTIIAVAKTKKIQLPIQNELRSTVATATVEEQHSCPTSTLDDLLLSLQLDPKIVTALSDIFSNYPTAGNHFFLSLGERFTNGQDNDVDTIMDTAAVDDAQNNNLLQQPLIAVPSPLVTLSRSTKVMAEDVILFDKNAFTIKGK